MPETDWITEAQQKRVPRRKRSWLERNTIPVFLIASTLVVVLATIATEWWLR